METNGARKIRRAATSLLCAAGSLLFALAVSWAVISVNEEIFYQKLAGVVGALSDHQTVVMKALKETIPSQQMEGEEILKAYGYVGGILTSRQRELLTARGLAWALPFMVAAAFAFWLNGRVVRHRTADLTRYLNQIRQGDYSMRVGLTDDAFSGLEDAIYKTVVMLRESREREQTGRENMARSLADISHQLKTPVTSISLLLELLGGHMQEDREVLERMGEQTDRLYTLTTALLTLSRADAGVLDLEYRQTDLQELMDCAASPVRALLEDKRQMLITEGIENGFLLCDLGWTAEALGNILKNCSEHTPSGSSIKVRVTQNPIFTRIIIEDEGPGFQGEECKRIFDRFYHNAQSAADSAGIGLALAKSLIEKQNGDIRAENREEGGARFQITFYSSGQSTEL